VAHESVLGNVLLGIEPTRFGWLRRSQMEALARPTLSALGLGDVPLDMPAGRLPIAAQQLVEIARALVTKSKVVILDEPTSSLTEVDVKRLFEVMRELKARGHALIYISHFLNEVRAIADTMTVLRDGTKVGERPVAGVTDDEIVSMMVGREIGDLYPRRPHTPGEAILRIDGLAGTKSPVEATLEVCRGEVVGIASEHDDVAGTTRGANKIFCFTLDGIRFCHMGDFGQAALRPEQLEAIGEVDVLFVPAGGGPTIGGDSAAAAVRAIAPRVVVPMHYRTPRVNFLDPPDEFVAALGMPVTEVGASEAEVDGATEGVVLFSAP